VGEVEMTKEELEKLNLVIGIIASLAGLLSLLLSNGLLAFIFLTISFFLLELGIKT
jgi:hypothetical protein